MSVRKTTVGISNGRVAGEVDIDAFGFGDVFVTVRDFTGPGGADRPLKAICILTQDQAREIAMHLIEAAAVL